MRLILQEIASKGSAVHKALLLLRYAVSTQNVWSPLDDIDFVFLCGANISEGIPSRRREALLNFAKKQLPNTQFFLAEDIFDTLRKEGHKKNILDVESDLFDLSDYIIIILESESAFCELGAFAAKNKDRSKIIVINDSRHYKSRSFINIGPIQAIRESSNPANIIYYKMDNNGRIDGDSIGSTFAHLNRILYRKPRTRRSRVEPLNPTTYFTKTTVRFLHDLIYFSGPIGFKEIDIMLKVLFGNSNHSKLRNHLGILKALNQVEVKKIGNENLYFSLIGRQYYEYKADLGVLISAFKNTYFKHSIERVYGAIG